MQKRILISCCLTLALFAGPAFAAQDSLPPTGWQQDGPTAHAEMALDLMIQGKLDEAFKSLLGKGYSKDKLEKLKFDLYRIFKKNGKPYSYEKILEQKAGSALSRVRYVLLFKKIPMMFDFYYYNSEKGWVLKTYTISTDMKKIFSQ
jgi:hypothetical protein